MNKRKKRLGRPRGGVNGQRVRDYPQLVFRAPRFVIKKFTTLLRKSRRSRIQALMLVLDYLEKYIIYEKRKSIGRQRKQLATKKPKT